MCQVKRETFDLLLPDIYKSIDEADFVSIDCEFTSLHPDRATKFSLFDSVESRYTKLANDASYPTVCQFGLSVFRQDPGTGEYIAKTYNVYVSPSSFACLLDQRFQCQASSFHFLNSFSFDFNLLFQSGVPYLSRQEEGLLREELASGNLLRPLGRNLSPPQEERINEVIAMLAAWSQAAKPGETFEVELELMLAFVLQREIESVFENLKTDRKLRGNSACLLVRLLEGESIKQRKSLLEEESLVEELKGLSKLINFISDSRKPLVGHNCLQDLLRIYGQFCSPLPPSYKACKQVLHDFFPSVFDTKFICSEFKREVSKKDLLNVLSSSNLLSLYENLTHEKCVFTMFPPTIKHEDGFDRYFTTHAPHEAGYDAFLAGSVFLMLGHILATKSYKNIRESAGLNFSEVFSALAKYQNKLKIARTPIMYVNLSGSDPEPHERCILLVKSLNSVALDPISLASKVVKWSDFDLINRDKSEAMIAVTSRGGANDILRGMKGDRDFSVVKYRRFWHSTCYRWNIGCFGFFVGAGLALCIKYRKFIQF